MVRLVSDTVTVARMRTRNFAIDAVVVEVILEHEGTWPHICDRGARQSLRAVEQLRHEPRHAVGAMLTKQHTEPGRADMQRSPLRAKVAEHDTGNADIALDQRMQRRIGRAAIE